MREHALEVNNNDTGTRIAQDAPPDAHKGLANDTRPMIISLSGGVKRSICIERYPVNRSTVVTCHNQARGRKCYEA